MSLSRVGWKRSGEDQHPSLRRIMQGRTAVSASENPIECEMQRKEGCEGLLGRCLACIDKRPLYARHAPSKGMPIWTVQSGHRVNNAAVQCRRLCSIVNGQVLLCALSSVLSACRCTSKVRAQATRFSRMPTEPDHHALQTSSMS